MVVTAGLRHAVFWVADPGASAAFYNKVLGLEVANELGGGDAIFMSSPGSGTDHDLGLFRRRADAPVVPGTGLYHLSWEVATLGDLEATRTLLQDMGAFVGENNHGVSRSVYAKDPDGMEFEVMWEVPADLLEADEPSNRPLDFAADRARFGNRLSRGAV